MSTTAPDLAPPVAQYVAPFVATLMPNARLLVQAGATDGELARRYHAIYPASSLLVVDADPARAQQARSYAERVYQADLNTADAAFYRQLEWADGWYFDATLEQQQDPLRVLSQIAAVLQSDASVVARITNAGWWNAAAVESTARHAWHLPDMLNLFAASGLRVTKGILLSPAAIPADVEATLHAQAQQEQRPVADLIDAAQPSHYLFQAVPAR